MRKRHFRIIIGIVLILLIAIPTGIVLIFKAERTRMMPFDQIDNGMSYEKVVSILGPPLDKDSIPTDIPRIYMSDDTVLLRDSYKMFYWYDGMSLLQVFFDKNMKVIGMKIFRRHY
jgi:hypothetical protein